MGTAIEARTACEEAVAVCNLADILVGAASSSDGTCTAVFPQIHVMLCVECYNTAAGGAGCGLDTNAVVQRFRQQAVRICVT